MVRSLGLVVLVVLSMSLMVVMDAEDAIAASCTTTSSHTICVNRIKRSAKQFWEYRAAVTVDGVDREVEVYNCRDRQRVNSEGRVVPFELGGAGEVICKMLYRPARSPLQ